MNRELLDRWCERGLLFLVLAMLVFAPLATGAVRTIDFAIVEFLTLGVLLLWLVRLWLNPAPKLFLPPLGQAALAFAAYAVGRYLAADLEYIARLELARVLVYTCLFFAIINNVQRVEQLTGVSLTLLFLAMMISFYAIYQFVTHSHQVWTFVTPYNRATGTFISPNNLAGFLELILPIGIAWTFLSRARPVVKIFTGYASLVILAGIATSASRGGWLSTATALALFFVMLLFQRTKRLPAFVALVLIAGGIAAFMPRVDLFKQRARELYDHGSLEEDVRINLWKPAWQLWKENPWWGIGPDHFNYRFRAVRPQTVQRQPDRVHNDYLNTLTDWGIVGTALVALAWACLFRSIVQCWRRLYPSRKAERSRTGNRFALLLGVSLGLAAILVHSMVDFNMHIPSNAIVTICWMAIVTVLLRITTEARGLAGGAPKLATAALLLVGMLFLGWQSRRALAEGVWLGRAEEAAEGSAARLAALQHAFAIEPHNFKTSYAIAETLRAQSWTADDEDLARKAMEWYQRGMKLNPYDGYNFMGYGICLDWLKRQEESEPYFHQAMELDPNGYFTSDYIGWHYVQKEDYAAARVWFERSIDLEWSSNSIAEAYLPIVDQRLKELATNAPAPFLPANK
jgi:O-antigen ligase